MSSVKEIRPFFQENRIQLRRCEDEGIGFGDTLCVSSRVPLKEEILACQGARIPRRCKKQHPIES